MAVEPDTYKTGMRQLAGGVTIITTIFRGERRGLTATAVCSVSADPPRLLCCVNTRSSAHDLIVRSGRFCINVLSVDDEALADRFGGVETAGDRFSLGTWTTMVTGCPVLEAGLASFDCVLDGRLPADSHSILIGRVEAVRTSLKRERLLYADGSYGRFGLLDPTPFAMDDER